MPYRLRWISCCEPIINTIASKSGVLYITVLLIAEKNKEVCFLTSDLFYSNIQIQSEQKMLFSVCLSVCLCLCQDIRVGQESSLHGRMPRLI